MKLVKSRPAVRWIVTAPSHKRLQSFAVSLVAQHNPNEHTHILNLTNHKTNVLATTAM
jgi:hypothetical protein